MPGKNGFDTEIECREFLHSLPDRRGALYALKFFTEIEPDRHLSPNHFFSVQFHEYILKR